jgi:hypothetical protein
VRAQSTSPVASAPGSDIRTDEIAPRAVMWATRDDHAAVGRPAATGDDLALKAVRGCKALALAATLDDESVTTSHARCAATRAVR